MRFNSSVVMINGAADGIGACTAEQFALEGAKVIITDIREKKLEETANLIKSKGGDVLYLKMDVTNAKEIDSVVGESIKKLGKIDILVQTAGIYKPASFLELTEEQFDETIRINLKGSFLCSQRVAKEMVRNNYGKIVLISSIAGQRGSLGPYAHYSASKGGVMAMAKTIARELAPYNINVNSVAPGSVKTNMLADAEDISASIPLGRPATSEEIANAIIFLASEDSRYITGTTIDVNGGWNMR